MERTWSVTAEAVRPEDGATVRRWSRTWFTPETSLEHSEDRYEVVRDGEIELTETHRQSPAVRSYALFEAWSLYKAAGFTDIQAFRGFSWEPGDPEHWLNTVAGRRP